MFVSWWQTESCQRVVSHVFTVCLLHVDCCCYDKVVYLLCDFTYCWKPSIGNLIFVKWNFWMFVRRWVSDRTFPWPVLCLVLTPEPAVCWQKLTVCSPGSEHVTLLGWSEISEAADSLSALHFHKSLHTLNWQISKWDSECGALRCVKMGVFWKQHGGNMMFLQNYNHSLFFWPRATRTANPGNRPRPPWRQKRRSDIRSLLSSEVSPGRGEEPTADRQLPEAPPPAGVEQHSPVVACTWLSGQTGTVHMWLWWWETGDFWCVDKFMMDFFTIKTLLNDLCGLFSF